MRVLGLQASHLLLIRTNLGYGTVLTAACARQGCSATDYYYYYYYYYYHYYYYYYYYYILSITNIVMITTWVRRDTQKTLQRRIQMLIYNNNNSVTAVPQLMRLYVDFSVLRSGFIPRRLKLRFMMDEVALMQVSSYESLHF
jgi:hypothetical protein